MSVGGDAHKSNGRPRLTRENRHEVVVLPATAGPPTVMTREAWWRAQSRGYAWRMILSAGFCLFLVLFRGYMIWADRSNVMLDAMGLGFFAFSAYDFGRSWRERKRLLADLRELDPRPPRA